MTHELAPSENDASHVANLLSKLLAAPDRQAERTLVAQCDAVILGCLAGFRGTEPSPAPSTRDRLLTLTERIRLADPSQRISVMRQIRRVLARLDTAVT